MKIRIYFSCFNTIQNFSNKSCQYVILCTYKGIWMFLNACWNVRIWFILVIFLFNINNHSKNFTMMSTIKWINKSCEELCAMNYIFCSFTQTMKNCGNNNFKVYDLIQKLLKLWQIFNEMTLTLLIIFSCINYIITLFVIFLNSWQII